ncbi:MAG: DUF1553 domain-containing protein [Planctomycetota bacterium]
MNLRNEILAALFAIAAFLIPQSALSQDTVGQETIGQDTIDFERQIKPILAENCFACHGIDAEARQAGLRLDIRDEALDALSPDDPESSSFVERIYEEDEDFIMPPPDSLKSLTDQEKELLKQWIAEGAEYRQHWSLVAPERAEPPAVENEEWIKNEIDRFVLARLEAEGLAPADEADPFVLFRRISLDITGLPPSPEEAAEFASQYSGRGDDALSDWIDKLMQRDSWGEHRGRYWLDAARYADTHGMHFDNYREMWPYRDWVIRSFNSNQPFDQFTIDQLAGDLLENPTQEQLVATGFQRCNMTTNEGGTIAEENLAIYASDRVQTFGWVYLGLTTNCAQCHDHKFDPISTKDYYSLAAFFRNTTQGAMDGNNKQGNGPVIPVPSDEDRNRWEALPDEIAQATQQREERRSAARPDFQNWLANVEEEDIVSMPYDGLLLHLPLNEGDGNEIRSDFHVSDISIPAPSGQQEDEEDSEDELTFAATGNLVWSYDGLIGPAARLTRSSTIELGEFGNFARDQPYSVGCWVKCTSKRSGAIIGRMDNENGYRGWDVWQNDGEFAAHIIDKWTENGIKVITKGNRVTPGKWQHVMVTWDGSGSASGMKIYVDGIAAELRVDRDTLKEDADTQTDTPLRIGRRSTGQYPLEGYVQDFVLYGRTLDAVEIANIAQSGPLVKALNTPPEERVEDLTNTLTEYFLRNVDERFMEFNQQVNRLTGERDAIRDRSPVTHVQVEKPDAAMTNILMRGAYDNPGDEVTAAPPSALHAMPAGAPPNRLGLARWVVDPSNPLTTRVTVNRFWQELFGQGLVASSEDFGVMGTPPSNQALLDWLAVDFRESGWDVKRFYKQVLMSATYRQAAITTPDKLLKDEDNSLISRGPRFRMDAEMVRDYALVSSGLMIDTMYGPGVRPYQPQDIWNIVGLPGGDTRNYSRDSGDGLYRRSLYSFWKRMAPPPNLEAFNAPNREVCTVRRERTNTPLQALVTLNDPQFFEAARVLAQNAMNAGEDNNTVLDFIAARTVCRPLNETERQIIMESHTSFQTHYQDALEHAEMLIEVGDFETDKSLDAAELAAWTMVCNQMLNLDEVLTK